MQLGEIVWLAVVGLALLGGLVSLGVGQRRWSVGTVVAAFLVLLSAATFVYLSARVAQRDRAWQRKIADYRTRIAKAIEDRAAAPETAGWEEGPDSLPRLRASRDRWRRGLDRIDTWHGRVWEGASFQPPKDDTSPARLEFAAEGNAEDSPPVGAGAHVFLFDAAPFEEGGSYIGEFLVQETSYDQATKRHMATVVQTAPRDAYDAKVLARPHDSVTVFEDLPVDRWLAFYRSRKIAGADSAGVLPEADKQDADKVRDLLESAPEVGALVKQFVEDFRQHEEEVPKDEWTAAEQEAADRPGELWAEVEFTKPHSFNPAGEPGAEPAAAGEPAAEGLAEDGPKRDFETGERAEFDLQTAVELRDRDEAVTIERVFRRRPLTDALTLLHGGRSAGEADDDAARGTTTLLRLLQNELAALERSNLQLRAAHDAAMANTQDEHTVAKELESDLKHWRDDAAAADALATAFQGEVEKTTRALEVTQAAIVTRGRELTELMTRLAREIDRVAPPPERRAARP